MGDDSDELLEDIDVAAEDVCFADKTIPERFQELLIVGLASEPSKRHASMRALVQELVLLRGPVLVPEPEEESAVVPPASGERPRPKGLGPVFGLMLAVGVAGVLGELYVEHRVRAVTESKHVITKDDEREFESPVEQEEHEDAITTSDESELDMRDEPELDLPKEEESEPFEAAEEALDKGDVQGCYNAWLQAYAPLVETDAGETARLSIELVDKIVAKAPGRPAAAWIARAAAEAYEIVGAEETTDDLTGWEQAVKSRRRAAELHGVAKEEDEAQQQLDCVKLNKEAKPCLLLFQGRDRKD